ncbi:hypothetical protein CROQUDRAFT_89617 [Cronartium quercuum f. sp. fusiforme G11]|uniref:Uncharacterized protein n=1 Tax=Cronartium quercuum f. sp. fusiforme G11 TaxID=708437 RepID=A0A9P6NRL2_9BASI|nr:hypothetical protein CROQUDRAFT_89617 [Cronartium quercuum f. sp. fusiforme G11]
MTELDRAQLSYGYCLSILWCLERTDRIATLDSSHRMQTTGNYAKSPSGDFSCALACCGRNCWLSPRYPAHPYTADCVTAESYATSAYSPQPYATSRVTYTPAYVPTAAVCHTLRDMPRDSYPPRKAVPRNRSSDWPACVSILDFAPSIPHNYPRDLAMLVFLFQFPSRSSILTV